MAPMKPPRKDDGPSCRVCGCTKHNPCVTIMAIQSGDTAYQRSFACAWVQVGTAEKPTRLCDACSGTAADMAEVIERGGAMLLGSGTTKTADRVVEMAFAAKTRYTARLAQDKSCA